jgi:hypothetical protein
MRILPGVVLLAVGALTAVADTNITGTWSGSFRTSSNNGDLRETTAYLVLKQSGGEITGTVGPSEDQQFPIVKGKVEGDKITIEVENEGNKIKLDLVLADDRITGDASLSIQGETRTAKVDVKRVK